METAPATSGRSLPAGLSLRDSGEIVGTPTVLDTQDFTVKVESNVGTTHQALSITVGVAQVIQPSDHCSDHIAYDVATFEDAALANTFRINGVQDLTCRALSRIQQLIIESVTGIQSLVGIQNLTGLITLELLGDYYISLLSGLTSLTRHQFVKQAHEPG